jgi:RNA polymerase sigma factor (sigma-70 family)
MSNKHVLSKNYLDITNKDNIRYLDEQNRSFLKYLENIRGYKRLDYDEEITIINKYQSNLIKEGDRELSKLIGSHQRFVVALAKKYCPTQIDILDLISEGNYGLIKAIGTYNSDYNVKFLTYASSYIVKYMFEFLDQTTLIHQQNRGKINQTALKKITEEFFQENGYYPNSEELQDEFAARGLNVKNARDFDTIIIDSLDAVTDEDDENYKEYGNEDFVINNNIDNEYQKKLISVLLKKLSSDEQKILVWKFGLNGDGEKDNVYIAKQLHTTSYKIKVTYLNIIEKLKSLTKELENKI